MAEIIVGKQRNGPGVGCRAHPRACTQGSRIFPEAVFNKTDDGITNIAIEQLAEVVAERIRPAIPPSVALWDYSTITIPE